MLISSMFKSQIDMEEAYVCLFEFLTWTTVLQPLSWPQKQPPGEPKDNLFTGPCNILLLMFYYTYNTIVNNMREHQSG